MHGMSVMNVLVWHVWCLLVIFLLSDVFVHSSGSSVGAAKQLLLSHFLPSILDSFRILSTGNGV